jgi:steroid 5-alpha reductase family enzyme
MDVGVVVSSVVLVITLYVVALFILSLILKRNDIADVAWGGGILLVGITSYVQQTNPTTLSKIVLSVVAVWAVRLSVRIFLRNKKKSEDVRYKKWREGWGRWFYIRSFFQVYILQGFLMLVVGYPLIHVVVYGEETLSLLFVGVGFCVWLFGFLFEVVGDYQLDRFLGNTNNKGKIMQTGLWQYSRHPNYFGEVVQWWGVWCMVLSVPFGVYAFVGPFMITVLILKVSGVPMLEESMAKNPDFEKYKKTTSVFFPLPPKRHE